jgi:glutamate formiminotransferase
VRVLDIEADPDHNRSVLTFVGEPGRWPSRLPHRRARALIDLNQHRG